MKIALSFEGDYLVIPADKAQPLIEALAHGQLYERKGWQDDGAEYQPSDSKKKPKVLFITDDQLTAQPEPIRKLHEEIEVANRRWLEAYQANNLAKERVKMLESKLESIGLAVDTFNAPSAVPKAPSLSGAV